MSHLTSVRRAARALSRTPGLAAVCVIVLAVGIGGNAAGLFLLDGALIRRLPYADAARLVSIDGVFSRLPLRLTDAGIELTAPVDIPDIAATRALSEAGAYVTSGATLAPATSSEPLPGGLHVDSAAVGRGFFTTLGIAARSGRVLTDDDIAQAARAAVISQDLKRRLFQGRNAVGGQVRLNGRVFSVVGVMPANFTFPYGTDAWIPRLADPEIASEAVSPRFIARLAPGATVPAARAELLDMLDALAGSADAASLQDSSPRIVPLRDDIFGDTGPLAVLLAVAATLVLIVACLNVATLLLVRVGSRQRELTVQRALGATTGRLVASVMTETLLLAVVATAASVPLAYWAVALARKLLPGAAGEMLATSPDVRLLVGVCLSALVAIIVVTPLPVLSAARGSRFALGTPRGSRHRWQRFNGTLVICQIAVTAVLLLASSTIIRTLADLTTVDIGADNDRAVVFEVTLPRGDYPTSESMRAFHARLRRRLLALPGVHAVGATSHLPGSPKGLPLSMPLVVPGVATAEAVPPRSLSLTATPGYFAALGIDVLAGRGFADTDTAESAAMAIVSTSVARALGLPPEEVVGRDIEVGLGTPRTATIAGVVADVRMRGPESARTLAIYTPMAQAAGPDTVTLVVDADGTAPSIAATVQHAARDVDPGVPLYRPRRFADVNLAYTASRRLAEILVSTFGVVALVLAGTGLYGVVACLVRLEDHDTGVRLAMGATPAVIGRRVLGRGVWKAAVGTLLGVMLAFGAWTIASAHVSMLGQPDRLDALRVLVLVLVLAAIASWFPARRAARTDPAVTLRRE